MAVPGYTIAQLPVEEISMGHSRADRAAIDKAVQSGKRPPGMAKNPVRTPALDRISTNIQARNAPKPAGSRIGSFAKGGAALGGVAGAADSLSDIGNGYRDKFQQDMGVETPLGSVAADTARTLANVGDAVTFGLAGRTGRGIAKAMGGGSFMEGFGSPSDRSQFLAQQGGAQAAPLPDAPAAAQPGVAQAQIPGTAPPAAPARPSIGKINVSRQPNGVMSFSGSGPVQGYEGPAAGQLKGGGAMGAVTPEDRQAALDRAAADKQSLISMVRSKVAGGNADDIASAYELAAGSPEAMAALEETRNQRKMQTAAMNGSREAAVLLGNEQNNATERLKIAQLGKETEFDKERTRGQRIENDKAAQLSGLVNQYLNDQNEATRADALRKINALSGNKDGSDKYILVDVATGQMDAMGNPVMAKMPFNTRTGQVVSTSGAGGGQQQAPYPDGTRVRLADGSAGIVKDGEAVPIQ